MAGWATELGAGWVPNYELPIINKLHLLEVIGNNAISYSSLGLLYYSIKHMPLPFGFQLPNKKTNAASIAFELTIVT